MSKVSNMNLIIILITLYSISASNPFKNIFYKTRSLQEITNVDFVKATNLTFNSGWRFDIKYYSQSKLPLNELYSTSILYNGKSSLAQCYVSSEQDYVLNCLLNMENQNQFDLVQINNALSEGATINWQNLTKVYNIPINTTLKYEDSFSLTYTFISSNSRYYDFRVKILENVLPENSVVNIDLYPNLNSKNTKVSSCIHKSLFLYCSFNESRSRNTIIQISHTRSQGSIEWENLENNITIPTTFPTKSYWKSEDLQFINNQWNYTIQIRSDYTTYPVHTLITLDTKIINKKKESKLYFTKCY